MIWIVGKFVNYRLTELLVMYQIKFCLRTSGKLLVQRDKVGTVT